ncbi:MAG: hypothetical protein ACTS4U_01360 [Candidatus Hodgkinia cicadicola]
MSNSSKTLIPPDQSSSIKDKSIILTRGNLKIATIETNCMHLTLFCKFKTCLYEFWLTNLTSVT